MPDFPRDLYRLEFVRAWFQLELTEPLSLEPATLLRLRRELHRAAGLQGPGRRPDPHPGWKRLLDPPLADDPSVVRRIQRPGPPVVLQAPEGDPGDLEPGDTLTLGWTFWGWGTQHLGDWIDLLQALGGAGLSQGQGRFELAGVEAEDPSGRRSPIWRPGDRTPAPPPLGNAGWWLEREPDPGGEIQLRFVTPARLLSRGRPLFAPDFPQLFPFLLRRVTSVALAHGGLELIDDPELLLAAVARVEASGNSLRWTDWRTLDPEGKAQDLGGVTGSIRLSGPGLAEAGWVIRLAAMLNLGKGAAFGSGSFRVSAA